MVNSENIRRVDWRKRATACVFALVLSVLTLKARLALAPWLGDHSMLIMFVLPILVSAYFGGFWAGLVSTAFCAWGGYYYVMGNLQDLGASERSIVLWQWGMLMVVGVAVSLFVEALHRSEAKMAAANRSLLESEAERKREAEALAASVSLLRTTMEATSNGLLVVDMNHRVTVFNTRFLEIMGVPRAAAEAGDDTVLLSLAQAKVVDSEDFLRRVREHYANPEKTSLDIFNLKDGRVIERISRPQRLGEKITGRVWSFNDVTELRRAEEVARERERLLRQVIDLVPHFIFAKDSQSRILLVNRACAEAHGLTVEEMTGRRDADLMHDPAEAEIFRRDDREVIRSGRAKFVPEERLTLRDGRVRILETYKIPFSVPEQSEPVLLGVAVDITERKAAEHQLQQMAVIVEASAEAVIGSDLEGKITGWNRGAEAVFGYTAAEMAGKPALLLYPAELEHQREKIQNRIARGEAIKQFEADRIRKDGKRIRIAATISPVRDPEGRVVGMATIARDISHQQMLEEQLRQSQKMEAIGQLAGGVAHDFNNVLAVIQMQIELAQMDGRLTPEQQACLNEVQTAAKRGANLTRQLLLFSRRQRLQPHDLDLNESLAGMTKMLRRILGEQVQTQFKAGPQPLIIRADAGMIDQVLMNLALNSRDAMPNGGQLLIEAVAVEMDELAAVQSPRSRPGSFVRLSVSDTGAGISASVLPHIFEPFFTTKDVGKGTGLGLATVFSIVQQHQGWIEVATEPGRGTTFDIYFPRQSKASGPLEAAAPLLAALPGGRETILLVEDDDALRYSVRRCLCELGYRLVEAASGTAALRVWQEQGAEIDLLLSDLIMPGGLTGKELGERLQRDRPGLRLVFISGYHAELFAGEGQGGVKFLAKPFDAQTLAQTVRACLDEKRSGGESGNQ